MPPPKRLVWPKDMSFHVHCSPGQHGLPDILPSSSIPVQVPPKKKLKGLNGIEVNLN